MSDRAVAARYAEGLYGAAEADDRVQAVRDELERFVSLLERAPVLRSLIERPDLGGEQKLAVLESALGGEFSPLLMGLLDAVLSHRRGGQLEEMARVFGETADRASGIVRAEAYSAVALTLEQRARMTAALARLTGGKVVLEEMLDPAVLCGARVWVGDLLIDGSGAGRLAQLHDELVRTEGRSA